MRECRALLRSLVKGGSRTVVDIGSPMARAGRATAAQTAAALVRTMGLTGLVRTATVSDHAPVPEDDPGDEGDLASRWGKGLVRSFPDRKTAAQGASDAA